jgi:hypothetical protein
MKLLDNSNVLFFKFLSGLKCKDKLYFNNNLKISACKKCNSIYKYQNYIIKFVNYGPIFKKNLINWFEASNIIKIIRLAVSYLVLTCKRK